MEDLAELSQIDRQGEGSRALSRRLDDIFLMPCIEFGAIMLALELLPLTN